MSNPYFRVMEIITSEAHDLRSLASIPSEDIFDFYNGANLRDIDLRGQDLRGLNFGRADLRGAQLENVSFDPGAFNGAHIDQHYAKIMDEFEF